jgi:Fic family protein
MRFPATPPNYAEILRGVQGGKKLAKYFFAANSEPALGYLHWDQLRRLPNVPEGLTHAEWWATVKMRRTLGVRPLPLQDKNGHHFRFLLPDPQYQELHQIDRGAGEMIAVPEEVVNPQSRDQYLISSLINEAITSSQLEGAVTTRVVAKEMIRTGRKPRDRSERMILNNYVTMRHIIEIKDKPLTKELVFELHRMVTEGTLDDDDSAGRFRTAGEDVRVEHDQGEVFHDPPSADQLEARMEAMCNFANGLIPDYFIHPVVRAILLHFWLAYDHPFVDGNGRTARALFYWAMLHSGYWLFEFVSISDILLKSPTKYYLAFLYSETDENDATYFIIHQLDVIRKGIKSLRAYISRKSAQFKESEKFLRDWASLNHRQATLVSHALRHPDMTYTVEAHQRSHGTVYETARRDLLELVQAGLLLKSKRGRTMVFRTSPDFSIKLKRGPEAREKSEPKVLGFSNEQDVKE